MSAKCRTPRIVRRHRSLCAAVGALALVLGIGGCSGGAGADDAAGQGDNGQTSSVLVQTTSVQRGSLPQTVTAYGTVQPQPSAHDSIVAPVAAEVAEVYVRRGQRIAADAPLVQLTPSPPTQAAYSQAQSAVQLATESVTRTRQLLGQLLATQQQLAEAQKAQSDALSALAALRAQGAGEARTLRAPFAAIVTEVPASVRSLVTEGTTLVELDRPSGLALTVGVPPDAAAHIAAGQAVQVNAIGETTNYTTTVLARGALVESDSGLVPVQIALPPGVLLPGESAEALITVGSVTGFVVPHQAVLIDDNGATYVVQSVNDTAKLVYVQVLGEQGDRDTVSGPLDARAPLVLSGNYQAHDGMKLRLTDTQPAEH